MTDLEIIKQRIEQLTAKSEEIARASSVLLLELRTHIRDHATLIKMADEHARRIQQLEERGKK